MTEFKAGDKVRVMKKSRSYTLQYVGKTGIIESIDKRGRTTALVKVEGDVFPLHHDLDALQLVEEDNMKLLHTYQNIGSKNGMLKIYASGDKLLIERGCFSGTLKEFEEAVDRKHGDNEHGKKYKTIIEALKLEYPELVEKEKKWHLKLSATSLINGGEDYLNKHPESGYALSNRFQMNSYQTIFTDSEIAQMDITGFKKVPADD